MGRTETRRYIYIMGRGHSGSTVLDSLLGNAPNAQGVGEMIAGLDGSYPCSCGAPIEECRLWRRVQEYFCERESIEWSQAVAAITNRAHIKQYPKTLCTPKSAKSVSELRTALEGVWRSISEITGNPHLVDSSKEISRGLFLSLHIPNARLIHIVRNPEHMLASNLHRLRDGSGLVLFRHTFRNERLAPLILGMSALSWVLGNLLCEVVRCLRPSKVIRVRYEDLCAEPVTELSRIAEFTGLDLDSVIQSVKSRNPLPIKHKLAGNRMAQKQQFTFDPQRASGRDLPERFRKIGRALALPMLKFYGYE
jgi:hypothetical protein